MKNLIIQGENIGGLNYLLNHGFKEAIDLIYVDPPFATGSDFLVSEGRTSTVSNSKSGRVAYTDKVTGNAFIKDIRERMILAKELLSARGSIYLHTDYKIGHYLKVMMDGVFGIDHFRNDITRIKCNPKNFKRTGYGNIKDMILFYSKGDKPIWHEPKEPYSPGDIERLYPKTDRYGRRYTTVPIHAPGEALHPLPFKGNYPPAGRHWRTDVATLEQWDNEGLIEWSPTGNPRKIVYADEKEGKRIQDIWTFKDPAYPVYPTEKNADLLDLIIRTSSNQGSIVLDFYCGSGTTLKAAAQNGRKWIGIDQSEIAIEATKTKMESFRPYRFIDLNKPEASSNTP
ncbi:MAG TPA: site-specific DNA-methyltransferase [Candidatus Gallibacteroides avistercoris]|uniref:site-specific DNA-methyltransferase (adenine-specific) n=1 Tax=Candidatus Gallibacteroides avistercoris TaxID=2840833 RepID=A0A9D1M852_9BACT|nr:site-specific DNA-methyltransferase [Candidatus Gallibacteroides avistercoris]